MVQRIDFQGGVIIWYKDTTKTTTMQEKKQKIYSTYYTYFCIALESLQAGRCHTHTIHMPYTYHTHTIPLSMATIWHHREKTEASPCITTTSYMRELNIISRMASKVGTAVCRTARTMV